MKINNDHIESHLLSFLNDAVRESELCKNFIKDATTVCNETVAEFFREIQAQDRLRMWRIQELLRRKVYKNNEINLAN